MIKGRSLRLFRYAVVVFALVVLSAPFLHVGKAHAYTLSPAIPNSVAPSYVSNYIASRCDPSGAYAWGAVQLEWISAIGSPSTTNITVTYGATSMNLQLNWITYHCNSVTIATLGSTLIDSTSPSISALNGLITDMTYPAVGTVGYKSGVAKTFVYTNTGGAPFTNPQTVQITMNQQGTITRQNTGTTCALVGTEAEVATSGPHDFNPQPGYCKVDTTLFTFQVTVLPPAYLDGYKMDVSGGTSNVAYSGLGVNVSQLNNLPNPSTLTTNPFYFTGSTGAIPAASSGSNHTVSLTSLPPGAWFLRGYTLCDGADPNCTNANLLSTTAGYFTPLTGGVKSFSYKFLPGHHYHMRWLFELASVNSCSLSISPTTLDPTTQFTVTATVNYSTVYYVPASPSIALTITNLSGGGGGYAASKTPGVVNGVATAVFGPLGPDPRGNYSVKMAYTDGGGLNCTNTTPMTIGTYPYISVNGGDMVSGGNITMFNQNGSGGYAGAGTQLAALAAGNITGFVTGTGLATNPTYAGLSFANTSGVGGGSYGGTFAANPPAYSPTISTSSGTLTGIIDVGSYCKGTYTVTPGSYIIGTLGSGCDLQLVSTGDIIIAGNISYSYGSINDVPRLMIVSQGGNILIDAGVSSVHGVLIAQPALGVGGILYTCSIGATPVDYNSASNLFGPCQVNQLTISGAVVADRIIFGRTQGSLKASAGVPAAPAEKFLYSAEVWLHRTSSGGAGNGLGSYNQYLSLPPIL